MLEGMDWVGDVIGTALRSGMFIFGLTVGVPLGVAYAVMRRWWRDHKTSKVLVKTTRRATLASIPRVLKLGAIAGVCLIVAVAGMTAAADEVPTQPASVPSGPASAPATSGK